MNGVAIGPRDNFLEKPMTDRSPAQITIGGQIPLASLPALISMIELDHALTSDKEEPVDEGHFLIGNVLELSIAQAVGGSAQNIEHFCMNHGISFARESDGCPGSYDAQRLLFAGQGHPRYYTLSDAGEAMLSPALFRALGSYDAIDAWFQAAEWTPEPISFDVTMVANHAGEESTHG